MNRLSGVLASSMLIMLIITLLPAGFSSLRVLAEPELSIPLYRNPRIDGAISANEYPVKQLDLPWGEVYAVHNASSLVFAIVLHNTCRRADFLFNMGVLNSTVLTVSTIRYGVERSGGLKYYYGHGEEWFEEPVSDVILRVVNGTVSWTIEILIPLSKLDVFPNTPRTLGFALIASGVGVNYSWPDNALLRNPSTWGVVSSPDNWATRSDIAVEGVYLDRRSLIAGSNMTLTVVLRNKGDAAIPDYMITIMLDDALLVNATGSQLGLKTPMREGDWVRYERLIVNVANGSYVVRVRVKALNMFYDANEDNNVGEESFSARYAKINVFGMLGITVRLDNDSRTITDESGTVFYVPVGNRSIRAQEVFSPVEGLRYVLTGWKHDSSTTSSPELVFTVEGDLTLTAEYRKEYLVNLSFADRDNAPITPSFYVCTLPNNTVYNGTLRSLWITEGSLRLTMVKYGGINVLDEIKIDYVGEPKEIRVPCNVVSGSVKVVDPFSMPIEGAELTAVFLNNTQAKYTTGPGGVATIGRVAGGELRLTVTNLGYSTTARISFLTEREVTIRIPMSLNIVLIILGALLVIVVIIVFKIFRGRERPTPRKTEEYEFEEL
jgi:hypothetical protein